MEPTKQQNQNPSGQEPLLPSQVLQAVKNSQPLTESSTNQPHPVDLDSMSDQQLDGLIGNDASRTAAVIDDETVTAQMEPLDEVDIYIKIIQSKTGRRMTRDEARAALDAERRRAAMQEKIKGGQVDNTSSTQEKLRKVVGIIYREYQNYVRLHLKIYKNNESLQAGIVFASKWVLDHRTLMRRPWLLLRGNVGTGKTTLSYAISRALTEWEHRESEVIDAITLADLAVTDRKYFESFYNKNILVIDDLGAEPNTVMSYGTAIHPLAMILTIRYQNWLKFGLTTIITTNLTIEQIERIYGVRVLDRLEEMCEMISFVGESYRYNSKFHE